MFNVSSCKKKRALRTRGFDWSLELARIPSSVRLWFLSYLLFDSSTLGAPGLEYLCEHSDLSYVLNVSRYRTSQMRSRRESKI